MSATRSARLIGLTTKEAFRIVDLTEGNGCEAWRLLSRRYGSQTDARLTSLILALVGFKITKGQGVQAGLVQWESQLLALERDQKESLSPKIRRTLLMNILSAAVQDRILEHLDRLVDYGQAREKVVSLVQMQRNPDAMDTNMVYGNDEELTEEPTEGYTEEEEAMDLAALAEVVCRRCNKKGHFARNCRSPPSAPSPNGKSKGKGTRFASSYIGKGGSLASSGPPCPGCGKSAGSYILI